MSEDHVSNPSVDTPLQKTEKAVAPQPYKSPAASHMLWFFLLPAFVFLGWATFYLVKNIGKKAVESTLVEKARSIENGRSDGDRWKAAYSLAEELLKKSKDGTYSAMPAKERSEIIASLSQLLVHFKEDARLKKYLILTLGRLNDVEALSILKENIKDKDEDLRFYSAWGYVGTLSSNPSQIKSSDIEEVSSWLKSEEAAFRKVAVSFLVQHGGAEKVLPLLSDKDKEVRWNTAVALGSVGRAEGVSTLKEIFQLQNLRDFGFRSTKDLEQLLRSAKIAANKLDNSDLNNQISKLSSSVDVKTPEGHAVESALKN